MRIKERTAAGHAAACGRIQSDREKRNILVRRRGHDTDFISVMLS